MTFWRQAPARVSGEVSAWRAATRVEREAAALRHEQGRRHVGGGVVNR